VDRVFAFIVFRTMFAVLAFAAIVYQLVSLLDNPTFHPLNFLSYFTIQSNIIGAIVLLIGAIRRDIHTPTFDLVRGGAVVFLVITGIVFSVLLSGTDVDTAIPWVNSVLHEVMPIVIVIDWLLDPPSRPLTYREGALWLLYPLAWLAYTLIKGPIAQWYPYPFVDPANGGYGSVALYSIAIFVLGYAVCAAVVWIGNLARRGPPQQEAAAA
jgi:hypothetical protein